MNRYKDQGDEELPESSYLSWKNPRKTGEFQKESYETKEQEQEHFDALHFLRDEDYNLRMLLGDVMLGIEDFERNRTISRLVEIVEEITGERLALGKNGDFELQCGYCNKTFSSDDYNSLLSAQKARGGHEGSAHREEMQDE